MKKSIFVALAAAFLTLAVSCKPDMVHGGSPAQPISENDLSSAFIVDGQFEDAACTKPQADGNYVKYHTSPAVNVQVTYVKGESESILSTGPSGVFYLYPKRKANPEQQFTVKAINHDGTITAAKKNIKVYVPTKLKPEYELLLTDAGIQSWTWNTDAECWFYGEGGHTGSGTDFTADNFDGAWWGATCTEDFISGYSDITASGEAEPDMNQNAYMTLDEEGNCVVYSVDGEVVRSGNYELVDWDPSRASEWEIGHFNTTTPCILFPYCIHGEAQYETALQVLYLDGNKMALVDPETGAPGDWDNITYWMFKVKK